MTKPLLRFTALLFTIYRSFILMRLSKSGLMLLDACSVFCEAVLVRNNFSLLFPKTIFQKRKKQRRFAGFLFLFQAVNFLVIARSGSRKTVMISRFRKPLCAKRDKLGNEWKMSKEETPFTKQCKKIHERMETFLIITQMHEFFLKFRSVCIYTDTNFSRSFILNSSTILDHIDSLASAKRFLLFLNILLMSSLSLT